MKVSAPARFARHTFMTLALFALVSMDIHRAFAQSEGVRRQSGMWQQTQTLLAIETPQASAAIATAARASIGRTVVSERVCIPPTAISRDTLTTRLSPVTPTSPTFRWTQLDLRETAVSASGIGSSGNISVEGKITPVLTDIIATSHITDPIIGAARRVQRTVIVRLGPC